MNNKGLTLIELLLVVVIITIITTLVIGIYRNVAEKSLFSVAKSNLHVIQKQIWLYYNVEGRYPSTLDDLVNAGYIKEIPLLNIKYHSPSREVIIASQQYDGEEDYGKWYYDNVDGIVCIACTHKDMDGVEICKW